MVINKNNGKIVIKEYNDFKGCIIANRVINSYNVIVLDNEGVERFKGCLKVVRVNDTIKYRFSHNSNNKELINYIVQELKKYKYIKE